jgi:hypothetical protein
MASGERAAAVPHAPVRVVGVDQFAEMVEAVGALRRGVGADPPRCAALIAVQRQIHAMSVLSIAGAHLAALRPVIVGLRLYPQSRPNMTRVERRKASAGSRAQPLNSGIPSLLCLVA